MKQLIINNKEYDEIVLISCKAKKLIIQAGNYDQVLFHETKTGYLEVDQTTVPRAYLELYDNESATVLTDGKVRVCEDTKVEKTY